MTDLRARQVMTSEEAAIRERHLRLGTHRENSLEMAEKGRWRNQFGKGHAA